MNLSRQRRPKARQPFRAVYRNILIGERAAAVYRLDTTSYEFLAGQGKVRLHSQLAWFAYSVEADFSLWRVTRAYPAAQYVAEARELVDERWQDPAAWEAYLDRHAEHIAEMRSFDTEVYLAIALPDHRRPWELRTPRRDATSLADAEQTVFSNLTEHLGARRARTHELQWLLRRAANRGIGEPELDPHWLPPALILRDGESYEPRGATTVRHAAQIHEEERALVVESEEGTSYQAMLTLGAPPRVSEFPGGAELLFAPLEALDFPVDAVAHVHWISNDEMQKLVGNRVRDADNAFEEQADASRSWLPEQLRVAARDVQEYFSTEPYPPGLEASISFAVGAPDREQLNRRVARLRKRFGAVKLHRPYGLQLDLYEDHLPTPAGATVTDYSDVLTMEQFGALMPIGTHHAGAARGGVYFAHTIPGAPRPVRVDMLEAARSNRSPATLLVGALGSGKTVAAQLLCYQAAMRGSFVVDVDPKPDHNLEGLPGLQGRVHVIELSGAEHNRGLLDPLVVAPEQLREDLAADYLVDVLPQAAPSWQTQIRKAVKQVMAEDDPSCMRVLDVLTGSPHTDARDAGEALQVWADSGLGRLGFGDGSRARASAKLPVTTIKASSLSLPSPGVPRGDYGTDERLSVATMKLLVGYAMRLVAGDRSVHKVLHFDEAHVLLGSRDSRRLLDRVNRMGRAMNASLLLSTQLLGDVGADIESLVGTRIGFGQETAAAAAEVLQVLGLEPTERLIRTLRGFRAGRGLMRGLDDRIAAIQVDCADPQLLAALSTTPEDTRELEAIAA